MGTTKPSMANAADARTRIRRIAAVVLRCLFVTGMMAGSFAALAYLSALQRVATRALQSEPGISTYAASVGIACVAPFCLTVLIAELQLALLLAGRWSWQACGRLLPWSFAALGGLFSYLVFMPGEHGPKETMLVAGGAMAAFLGSLLQLSLCWDSHAPGRAMDWPLEWTVALIMLGATFLGAMKGWTGPSPQFRDVLTHQNEHWDNRSTPDRQLPKPFTEPSVY